MAIRLKRVRQNSFQEASVDGAGRHPIEASKQSELAMSRRSKLFKQNKRDIRGSIKKLTDSGWTFYVGGDGLNSICTIIR